jgi:orotate phosphoribosyltransferase
MMRMDDEGIRSPAVARQRILVATSLFKQPRSGGAAFPFAVSMLDYKKTFLALALKYEVLKFGAFTLKSGRVSPYFFNLGKIASGAALRELGGAYAAALTALELDFDLLFGPAYKGIPLAAAVSIALADSALVAQTRDVAFAYNRKEAKDHGEGGLLVGAAVAGQRVVIVDDVLTAGTALRESHALLMKAGANPIAAITALDRQEVGPGGRLAVTEITDLLGFPVHALVTVRDLLDYLGSTPGFIDVAAAIRDYQNQYGDPGRS